MNSNPLGNQSLNTERSYENGKQLVVVAVNRALQFMLQEAVCFVLIHFYLSAGMFLVEDFNGGPPKDFQS